LADQSALAKMIARISAIRDAELSRCVKACMTEPKTGIVTPEAERVIADMRKNAKLFSSSITRDRSGKIDQEEMLRMEGRREIVLRFINLLELDPSEVAQFVEVDNGQG
jgi:hypothetical protein